VINTLKLFKSKYFLFQFIQHYSY